MEVQVKLLIATFLPLKAGAATPLAVQDKEKGQRWQRGGKRGKERKKTGNEKA